MLVAEVRGKRRVVCANAAAAQRGVLEGMSLEGAQALASELLHRDWNEEELAVAALRVTTALIEASPRVAWARGTSSRTAAQPSSRLVGAWWVDAAGLGDEQRLAQKLLRIAKSLNVGPARVGIADSAIAAWAATFRHPRDRRPGRVTACVPSGRDAAFLAPYPLSLLDLDDDLAETLQALGLDTMGALAALDGDEVESRFGFPGLAAHRLARGIDHRGPSLPRDDALPVIDIDLGSPVSTAEPLLFVLKGALSSLGGALRNKGLAAREIEVALTLDDGSTSLKSVRPARPSSHDDVLFDHVRALLDDWPLPEPVTALNLRASITVPAAGEQGSLLVSRWADPAALEAAFDRIRGSEGEGAVAIPEARDGHLPGDAGKWCVVRGQRAGTPPLTTHHSPLTGSALRLLESPAPIRVRMGRAGLEAIRQGDLWTDLDGWSGPEHLAPRWWKKNADAASRDYFTARTRRGEFCLLYRTGKDPQWFLEGWWD